MEQCLMMAIALVLIFEGILPFLSPRLWRRAVAQVMSQSDKALHVFGLVSMLIGVALLYWVH